MGIGGAILAVFGGLVVLVAGGELLVRHFDAIVEATLDATEQDDSRATYGGKISKQDAQLDWQRAAVELHRQVRAYNPVPGAFFLLDDMAIKCWQAGVVAGAVGAPGEVLSADRDGVVVACGRDALRLDSLQRPGKRPVTAGEFAGSEKMVKEAVRSLNKKLMRARVVNEGVRMDGRGDLSSNLVVWQDDQAVLFVPKAQTSQWELQLMTKPDNHGAFPGSLVETTTQVRRSLDLGILMAQKVLADRGASMVTTIEYSKRFTSMLADHPLIYCFLPKLPQSMGAFSEAQLRFISGHYPEDFATVCRQSLQTQSLL